MIDTKTQSGTPGAALWRTCTVACVALFLLLVVRTAWLSDDSYITFRTVDNFLHGFGLRWNVDERVQTYTHPLWMFLLAGLNALTGELYFSTLGLSLVLSLFAVLLVIRVARTPQQATVAVLLLAMSKAFVDFSTSGLENPLTHVLLAGFAAQWFGRGSPGARLVGVATLAGLLALDRLDTFVLTLPCVLAATRGVGFWRSGWRLGLGYLPLFAWLGFAFFYYGTPLPNTAYAKALSHGIALLDLAGQSAWYFADSLRQDPITLTTILAAIIVTVASETKRLWPITIGALLYLAYVVKIGGDFMTGRFLAAPLLQSVVVLARATELRGQVVSGVLVLAAIGFGLLAPRPNLSSGADYRATTIDAHGIADERGTYYRSSGLLRQWTLRHDPTSGARGRGGAVSALLRAQGKTRKVVCVVDVAGVVGYGFGPLGHFVDIWLCDPLLARLPVVDLRHWRTGHYEKRIPEGYIESIATNTNRIRHPRLAHYYEALRQVTRGELWSLTRLRTAWDLLLGRYDGDLQAFVESDYRHPPLVAVDATALAGRLPRGTRLEHEQVAVISEGGLLVRFDSHQKARRLELGLDARDRYRLVFLDGSSELGSTEITTRGSPLGTGNLEAYLTDVPTAVSAFTAIRIEPVASTDRIWAIGWLRVPN